MYFSKYSAETSKYTVNTSLKDSERKPPTFCLKSSDTCDCVTLTHQSVHLFRLTGFINMLLSNITDTVFPFWDIYSLISLPSFHINPSFSVYSPLLSPLTCKMCPLFNHREPAHWYAVSEKCHQGMCAIFKKVHVSAFS